MVGGGVGVKFLASENWCGRVHFGGHSPEWRVLSKFSVQPCNALHGNFSALCKFFSLFLANPAKERFKQQQHKLL